MKLRLQGALAACVRAATTTFCASGAVGPEAPQDVVLELDARTVTEALRLVAPQAPGFEIAFRAGAWRITVDGAPLRSERELDLGLPDRAYVSVAPALAGQGPGIGAVGWWIIGLSAAAAVYAVTQIPEIPDTDHLETGERRTLFSGPVNSAAQGGAVPLIYGKTRVGSTVVSGGITQERPTGGDNASPPDVGLGGERPPGTERPGQDRGRDAEEEREPGPGGAAAAERSVLRVVDLLGEGEIGGLVDGLKSVFIDGVAVEDSSGAKNIEGVSIQERKGLAHAAAGWEALAGFDSTSTGLTHSSTEVKRATPVVGSVPAGYDAARVTLRWPRLVEYDDKGNEIATSVVLQIDSRPSSSGSWTTVLTQTVRDLSLDEQELSWRVERPQGASGTWQIRVSRLTADSTSTRVVDAFYWQRLAGLRDVKQSYPHSAVIGLVIETDRSDVNPTRREYEVYGRWVLAPPASIWDPETPTSTSAATYGSGIWDGTMRRVRTDNQAWIVYDLLTDRRAGLGGIPGMVDAVRAARAGFLELSRRCDALVPAPDSASAKEPRWRFHGSITRREQARKVIDWFLSGCRAGTSWSAGAAALAIDGEFDVSAAIGNANVIDGEFEYQGLRWQERYSAVAVTWQDPDDDYRSGIELVVVDDLVAKYGFRQKDVAAVGCTSRGQAHRVGLLVLNEQENESETVKFRMALEGMHLRPGDRVRIADEQRFEVRAAFRVTDVDTSVSGQETLTLDGDSPRLAAGGTIAWGAGRTAAVSQKSGQSSQAVLVTTDVPTELSVGDLVVNASGAVDWIVTEVNERDKVEVEVQARRYDPNKYTAVEQRRQLARPPVNPVADILAPSAVTVRERTYEDRNQVRSLLEISVRGGNDPRIDRLEYQIQRPKRRATAAEIAAGDWSVLPRGPWEPLRVTTARSIVERNVALGGYRVRARFLGGRRRSGWTESPETVADGKTDALAAPTGLAAEGIAGGYWSNWIRPGAADYAYTEIWDKPGTAGAADADVDVDDGSWTLRGTVSGSAFARLDVSDTAALRVAVRHFDTSDLKSPAREVGVTPLEAIEGADGVDGVGVEHGFRAIATNADPAIPDDADDWLYDEPQDGWTDGASANLSPSLPWLQRISRPVPGLPSSGDSPLDDEGNRRPGWGSWQLSGRWRGYALGEQALNVSVTARSGGGSSATTRWTNPAVPPATWRLVINLHVGATEDWRVGTRRYVAGGAANASMQHNESFPSSPAAQVGDLVTVEVSPASGTAPNYEVSGGVRAQTTTRAPALGTPVPTVTGGDEYLDVDWSAVSGATSSTTYEIWYGSGSNNPGTPQITGITGTSRRITGLVNGTRYWIRVRAREGTTTSNWSSSFVSGTPVAACPAVGTAGPQPTASVTNLTATISWAAQSGAAQYKVYVDGSLHETTTGTSLTYTGTAGSHSARVSILNSCGNEGPKGTSRSFTLTDPPAGLSWGSWSSFAQGGGTPSGWVGNLSDVGSSSAESDGFIGSWDGDTAGMWSGGATNGVIATYSVLRDGAVDVIQAAQSYQSTGNNMRDPDTDGWISTDVSLLNPSGDDLENYHHADFDFVSAIRRYTIQNAPSFPAGSRGMAFVAWRRNTASDATSGSGKLWLLAVTSSGLLTVSTRDYE